MVGRFKLIVWRETKGGKPQSQRKGAGGMGGSFYGGVDLSDILSELRTYFRLL